MQSSRRTTVRIAGSSMPLRPSQNPSASAPAWRGPGACRWRSSNSIRPNLPKNSRKIRITPLTSRPRAAQRVNSKNRRMLFLLRNRRRPAPRPRRQACSAGTAGGRAQPTPYQSRRRVSTITAASTAGKQQQAHPAGVVLHLQQAVEQAVQPCQAGAEAQSSGHAAQDEAGRNRSGRRRLRRRPGRPARSRRALRPATAAAGRRTPAPGRPARTGPGVPPGA